MANKSQQSSVLFTVPGTIIINDSTNDKESVLNTNTVKTLTSIPTKSRKYKSKGNVEESNTIIVMYSLTEKQ